MIVLSVDTIIIISVGNPNYRQTLPDTKQKQPSLFDRTGFYSNGTKKLSETSW